MTLDVLRMFVKTENREMRI